MIVDIPIDYGHNLKLAEHRHADVIARGSTMPRLTCEISQSLMDALEAERRRTGESLPHVVMRALADALQVDHATLFQVSTSGALVEGVVQGAVTAGELARHGDFGLGTFADLDGEMVVLGGRAYRVRGNGEVSAADDGDEVPFAVVTNFRPEARNEIAVVASYDDLTARLDAMRTTGNQFFAARLEGCFAFVKTRAVCKVEEGTLLTEAASRQAEFEFHDVAGVLVGLWTPEYAKTVNVTGWHLHFLTEDRRGGGHLLACQGGPLTAEVQHLADFRMAIPETAAFLAADLTHDPSEALERAEKER